MQPSTRQDGELAPLVSSTAIGGGGAARVTSDATSAVGIRIAANNVVAAVTLSAAAPGGTTPRREGFAATTLLPPLLAATRCNVGLQTSCTGVGAMLKPGIPKKTRPARIEEATKGNIPGGERHDP